MRHWQFNGWVYFQKLKECDINENSSICKLLQWWLGVVSQADGMFSSLPYTFDIINKFSMVVELSRCFIRSDGGWVSLPQSVQITKSWVNLCSSGWVRYEELMESALARPARPCVASQAEDIAQLFFTSGTTGKPKMVPHTQASYGIGHIGTMRCFSTEIQW